MMNDRPRILHITSWYPSSVSAQNGNFIQRHVSAISKYSDSYLLHVVSDPETDEWNTTVSEEDGFHSAVVIYPRAGLLQKFSANRKAHHLGFEKLEALADTFDLVHVHVMYPGIAFGHFISAKLDIPLVVTEHATAYHSHHPETYSFLRMVFLRWYGRKVRGYFPVSEDLANAMEVKGLHRRFQVIPNVVDTALFTHKEKVLEGDAIHFLHISSLKNAHKNVTGLLSAFATLIETYPKARLTIIGNEHHEQIERYIHKLRLINEVKMLKEVPIASIAKHMHESHALLLFSNYENAPCVISEAHCTGLPVIATRVGGVAEMVDSTNGILVESGDMLGLYAAMEQMIQSYGNFDSKSISVQANERYQYEHVGQRYLEAYQDVLSSL